MENHPNNPLTQQIQAILAEAIQVPIESISPNLAFGDLPEWDSLGHMEVMMLLEERFGVEVSADTIAALISIPEIYAHLEANGHAQ